MKVKELNNKWKAIHFTGRTVLYADVKYMSNEQVKSLMEVEVVDMGDRKGHYMAI